MKIIFSKNNTVCFEGLSQTYSKTRIILEKVSKHDIEKHVTFFLTLWFWAGLAKIPGLEFFCARPHACSKIMQNQNVAPAYKEQAETTNMNGKLTPTRNVDEAGTNLQDFISSL